MTPRSERGPVLAGDPLPEGLTNPDSSWVKVASYSSHEITMTAFTSSPALLVLSEVYYPAGWTAAIDGADTKIYRTNAVLRSVLVPAGNHEVKFTFAPETYRLGSTVTTVGWVVVLLLIGVGAARDERVRGWFRSK